MKERVGFAGDSFVCLMIFWLAQEEKCGQKNGVRVALLR